MRKMPALLIITIRGLMRTIKIWMLLGVVVLAGCVSNSVTVVRDDTFQSSKMASLACMPFVKALVGCNR